MTEKKKRTIADMINEDPTIILNTDKRQRLNFQSVRQVVISTINSKLGTCEARTEMVAQAVSEEMTKAFAPLYPKDPTTGKLILTPEDLMGVIQATALMSLRAELDTRDMFDEDLDTKGF